MTQQQSHLQLPPALVPGDTVAIVSPASAIDPELVSGAVRALEAAGFRALVMPHTLGCTGTYSAGADERLADLTEAMATPGVRAILCSRGGYGAVHLLGRFEPSPVWLIGFSDVSALHALWHRHGIASVHGSMARHLALFPADDPANVALMRLLTHREIPSHSFPASPLNRCGQATAPMVGGNLAVLSGLISTPMDMLRPGTILVIEDIAEPIYKVERILHQLRLNGVLPALAGLVVGQFTDYRPDPNHPSMEEMIARMVEPYSYPVAFGAPFGHVDTNMPFVQGAQMHLQVTPELTTITPCCQ